MDVATTWKTSPVFQVIKGVNGLKREMTLLGF